MKKTLLVTNDFPPRAGGIQTYLEGFARQLDPEQLIVYASTPTAGGHEEYDSAQPWTTIRNPSSTLLPRTRVRNDVQHLIREHKVANVWFGASTPLGILAESAREAGATHILASTHGHEIGWSMMPGTRQYLQKVFDGMDTVTYLTQATLERLQPHVPDHVKLLRLPGGIDPEAFAFNPTARKELRQRYSIPSTDKVVVCISRLVERKGQDLLIEIWPEIVRRYPGTRLVIVGKGPYGTKLQKMAAASSASQWITFTGEVPQSELPAHYSLGDIFAMPCRTRGGGLDIEGLGIVYLEAYAAGLPVVAGDSGGAPEAVLPGETGLVASGRSTSAVAGAITYLLEDPERARQMGATGRVWLDEAWRWDILAKPLIEVLS